MDCSLPGSLSMEFSKQEYWSGLPFPSPRDLPDPGIKPMSLASPALAGRFFASEPPGNPIYGHRGMYKVKKGDTEVIFALSFKGWIGFQLARKREERCWVSSGVRRHFKQLLLLLLLLLLSHFTTRYIEWEGCKVGVKSRISASIISGVPLT